MVDVDRYLAKYPPSTFYRHEGLPVPGKEPTVDTALTYQDCEAAWASLAGQAPGPMSATALREWALKRMGHDGSSTFQTVKEEAQAIALTAQEMTDAFAEVVLSASNWGPGDTAAEVARIAQSHDLSGGTGWDMQRIVKDMQPASYSDPVRVEMTEPDAAASAEILRLSSPDALDFTQPPQYGTAKLITRKQHRNSVALAIESPAEAVIRLTDEADQIAHGSPIALARKNKQQAKQHIEHDDDDHGTGAQSLDHDAEIARYLSMAERHHTTHGNKPGRTAPPGEPGQFTKGDWHSSHAPLRKSAGKSCPGRRAPSWAPGYAAAGVGGDLDAGGGADQ